MSFHGSIICIVLFPSTNVCGGFALAWMTQDTLTGLIRLRSLDLSSNKLTLIEGALETLINLEQLNLRGNALVALGPDIFKVKKFIPPFLLFELNVRQPKNDDLTLGKSGSKSCLTNIVPKMCPSLV